MQVLELLDLKLSSLVSSFCPNLWSIKSKTSFKISPRFSMQMWCSSASFFIFLALIINVLNEGWANISFTFSSLLALTA